MNLSLLRKYGVMLRRRWWLLLVLPALAALVSLAANRSFSPIYQAHTIVLVSSTGTTSMPGGPTISGSAAPRTYATLLTTTPALTQVIRDLGLKESPGSLAGDISVTPRGETGLLDIVVSGRDPRIVQAVANDLVVVLQHQIVQPPSNTQQISDLEGRAKQLQQTVNDDQDQVTQLRALRFPSSSQKSDLANAEDRLKTDTTAADALTKSLNDARANPSPPSSPMLQIEKASRPTAPINDHRSRDLQIAVLAGILTAVALTLVIETMGRTVRDPETFERRLRKRGISQLRVLASIPYDSTPQSGGPRELITLRAPHTQDAEAYRTLRTNVLFSRREGINPIVVTSPGAGEGKSRTCANLAVVLAQANHRVLLIDADLRRPSQHLIFGHLPHVGLSNLILQDGPLPDLALATGVPNLWLLPAGPIPPNPSEMLGSKRMQQLLAEFMDEVDMIVIDTPPIGSVTDAAVLAARGGGCLLVAEHRRTPQRAIERACHALDQVGGQLLGAVLNKEHLIRSAYYQYYSSAADASRPITPQLESVPPTSTAEVVHHRS